MVFISLKTLNFIMLRNPYDSKCYLIGESALAPTHAFICFAILAAERRIRGERNAWQASIPLQV
jgi:hypothetical protein